MTEYYHGKNAEIVALMHELQDMPERTLLNELQSLDVSIYIYKRNHDEAIRFIGFIQDDPSNQDLWHMTTIEKSRSCHYELARLLQNYVASVKSLVDHTREMTKRLYGDGRFPDYQSRVDEVFKSDPLVQFVQCLRNILLHDQTAPLVFHGKMGDPGEATNELGLSADVLRKHSGWLTAGARDYLLGVDTTVDIPTVIREYDMKVNDFYSWFGRRQREIHADEIDRFAAKERELFLMQIEDHLDAWFFNPNADKNSAPSDRGLFLGVFDISEFDRLSQMPEGSKQRADLAVALLKARFDVPAGLEEKIRRAYSDPNFFRWDAFKPMTMDEWIAENSEEGEAE